MKHETKKLLNWAVDLEEKTLEQARRTSRLPFIAGHVALMPDAHWGLGATIGSVLPTDCNFLLWQAAYSELVFLDANWPDFTRESMEAALAEYHRRDRRYGGTRG